jgi:hypothetical protein
MAKILFGGVHLLDEVDRLGGVGFAYANTSYFRSAPPANHVGSKPQSYSIELDTDTGLVTVTAEAGGAVVVPLGRVKRFEPLPPSTTVEDAAPEKRGPGRPRKDAQGDA